MKVILRKNEVELTREEVRKVAGESKIVGEGKTRYMVVVNGIRIPAKRLLFTILKSKGYPLTLQDISTKDAVHVFRKLGFEIVDMKEERKKSLLELAGVISLGGNAVEDERKLYSP